VSVSRTARALAAGALLSLAPGIGARAQTPFVPPIPQPALDAASVRESLYHSEALAEQNEMYAQIHLYEVLVSQ
jgi:hypothetical protein